MWACGIRLKSAKTWPLAPSQHQHLFPFLRERIHKSAFLGSSRLLCNNPPIPFLKPAILFIRIVTWAELGIFYWKLLFLCKISRTSIPDKQGYPTHPGIVVFSSSSLLLLLYILHITTERKTCPEGSGSLLSVQPVRKNKQRTCNKLVTMMGYEFICLDGFFQFLLLPLIIM